LKTICLLPFDQSHAKMGGFRNLFCMPIPTKKYGGSFAQGELHLGEQRKD
jgi:hypothetical protein